LSFGKRLFGFENFCALQVTDLGGDSFDHACDEREGGHELRMPIPRNNLGCDRFGT
jgi:hypothetical protein